MYEGPEYGDANSKIKVELSRCKIGKKEWQEVSGRAQISVKGSVNDYLYGDIIRFKARLGLPKKYNNPKGFDYRDFLLNKGIGVTGYMPGMGKLERLGVKKGFWIQVKRSIEGFRSRIRGFIDRNLSSKDSQIIKALILGDRGITSYDVEEAFRRAGVMHILVISGLHVGFVATAFFVFFKTIFSCFTIFALRFNVIKIASFVTIVMVLFYVLFTGSHISTVRAGIMITVYLVSIILDRRQDIYVTLAIAAIIILLQNLFAIFEISFQLSFIAVLSIVYLYPKLEKHFPILRGKKWRIRPLQLVAVSTVVLIGVGPVIAYNFNQITIMGLIANVVVIPLVGILMVPFGLLLCMGCSLSETLAGVVLEYLNYISSVLLYVVEFLSRCSDPFIIRVSPTLFEILLFYTFVLCLINWRSIYYKKVLISFLSIACLGNFFYWGVLPYMNKELKITFLDVGQGDSILVQFPSQKVLLIDGGGIKGSDFDLGKNVIAPYLLKNKIKKVDYIINTHPHHDHYKGLSYIIQNFSPEKIWINAYDAPDDEYAEWMAFRKSFNESGAEVSIANEDTDAIIEGDVRVEFLSPPVEITGWERNDTSIVNKIVYGDVRVLLAGDLAKIGERWLMGQGGDLKSDILKIGHHGAFDAGSDLFLDAVNPAKVIISAGLNNIYGVPHQTTLNRLNKRAIEILRTDINGAIEISTDGKEIKVATY